MIPILAKIEEDELFSSWTHYMAVMNDMTDEEFGMTYFREKTPQNGFRTDFITNLENACGANRESSFFPDTGEIILHHTIWPSLLPFLTLPAQARRLEFMLRSTESSVSALTGYVWVANRHYSLCPICLKEDMEKVGRPVIHTPHQMPGVTCCAKHGMKLIVMDRPDMIPDTSAQKAEAMEISTARFFEDMYHAPVFIHWKETVNAVRARLADLGKDIEEVLRETVNIHGFSDEEISSAVNFQNHGDHGLAKCIPILLSILYPSYRDFVTEVKAIKADDIGSGTEESLAGHFDIIGEFGSVMRYRCRTCGETFHMHPWAATHGIPCPACAGRKSEEDVLREMVSRMGDGNHELTKIGPGKNITIRHTVCGTDRTGFPSLILWQDVTCVHCEEARKKALWDHTGETVIQKNGQKATVGIYRKRTDADIVFEDGTVVRNANYGDFLKGNIHNHAFFLEKRLSLKIRAKNGQIMWVSDYRGCDDIDVTFEDGTIVRNKDFERFMQGKITNPNCRRPDRIGGTVTANNGQRMKITAYRNSRDIDVEFEDGTVVRHVSYANFLAGRVLNPNFGRSQKDAVDRVDQTIRASNGQIMKIIVYRRSDDIDVEFDDGTVVRHKTYHAFKTGQIANPKDKKKECRIGETRTANNGQEMTIVRYRNNNDIDVRFSDGTVAEHKTYRNFLSGRIANPKTAVHRERVGETVTANCGMEMTIIAYRTSADLDIQFSDGTVVEHRSYRDFRAGVIAHPTHGRSKRL